MTGVNSEASAVAVGGKLVPGAVGRPGSSQRGELRLSNFVLVASVTAFFFASGASGLIYQVAWVRILSLIFGVTVHAVSAVLAGFMAGLALGSYLAGRLSGRISNPLRVYALIEIGIGLTALATPRAFAILRDAYPGINRVIEAQAGAESWIPGVVRLALAFGILLVPTTLMGATLPVILKSSLVRGASLGRSVSVLYAINTFGAIAGTVGAGFYLIAGYGVQASIQVAAAVNLAIGVVALGVSLLPASAATGDIRRAAAAAAPARLAQQVARGTVSAAGLLRSRRWVVFLAFAVSGLCGLGYEVIWFRLLGLFGSGPADSPEKAFENSTYAFTVMLATVLFGIAAGSYAIGPLTGRVGRRVNWWIVFALLEWGIGVTAVLSVTALGNLTSVVGRLSTLPLFASVSRLEDGFMILAAFASIFPSMFLSGMTFPVAALLVAGDGEEASRRVGSLYAINTVGAIAGSLVAGFYLLPVLASQRALLVLATASVLAGFVVLWAARGRLAAWPVKVGVTVAGVAGFALATQVTPNMHDRLLADRFQGKEIVWFREGLESSVTIVREPDGYITLYTNNRGQARDEPPLVEFHRLLGHMPMLVHPNPKRALIVGIGGGATAGAVAQYPGVQVDAVELSDAVIDAVRLFGHVNYRFYDLPNVNLVQNDARNHMLLTDRKYSVISGDAIRPNDAGATALYSVEYYRLCLEVLEDDGVMTQWLPPFSDYQYKLIMRTFLAAFPYVTLWQDGDLLIGSKRPITIERAALAARMADPRLKPALDPVRLGSVDDVLSRFNASEQELRRIVGDGPIITDDRPYIEYFRSLPQDGPPNMRVYSRNVRDVAR